MLNKRAKFFIAISPIVLTVCYELGARMDWWDTLLARDQVMSAIARLCSNDRKHIRNSDSEYKPLLRLTREKTGNQDLKRKLREHSPLEFVRMGGDTLKVPVPPHYPPALFVPDTNPVVAVFSYKKEYDFRAQREDIAWVGTVGDIKRWVNETREKERFLVLVVAVALLSIATILSDSPKS